MDSPHDQSPADSSGETPPDIEVRTDEKVDIDIGEIITIEPERIPEVIKSFNEWSKQWD